MALLTPYSGQKECFPNDVRVDVVTVTHHPPEDRDMVWLCASDTALLVTADHRIVVPRGHGAHQQL